jgi:hypothetical protein
MVHATTSCNSLNDQSIDCYTFLYSVIQQNLSILLLMVGLEGKAVAEYLGANVSILVLFTCSTNFFSKLEVHVT